MSEHLGKVIQVRLLDKTSLYNCYMSFTADGGIFVPSSAKMHLGDPVHLIVNIPEPATPFLLSGKVAWISHGRRPGFGVRFGHDEGSRSLKVAIENLLGTSIRSATPTYTA